MNPDDRYRSQIASLTARLDTLEAERAACTLMHTYAATLDRPDPDELAALFTTDGILVTSRSTHRGHDDIAGFFRAARATDDSEKRHFLCQPAVHTTEPGLVALDCYFTYTARGAERSMLGWGTYSAQCRIESGRAYFTSLIIDVHLGTDLGTGWPR